MADLNIYYVYVHYNLLNNKPFYVGRGKNNRLNDKTSRNKYWNSYAKKYGFFSEKIEENLNLKQSCELEIYWISQFKTWGFNLTNLSNGGEGNNCGAPRTLEWNKKLSLAKIGKTSNRKGKSLFKTEEERNIAFKNRKKNIKTPEQLKYAKDMNIIYKRNQRARNKQKK